LTPYPLWAGVGCDWDVTLLAILVTVVPARSNSIAKRLNCPMRLNFRLIGSPEVYRMLKYGQRYVDKGTEYYEQRYRNQQIQLLRKNATKLGCQITEARA